jgi:hypothetical protein
MYSIRVGASEARFPVTVIRDLLRVTTFFCSNIQQARAKMLLVNVLCETALDLLLIPLALAVYDRFARNCSLNSFLGALWMGRRKRS